VSPGEPPSTPGIPAQSRYPAAQRGAAGGAPVTAGPPKSALTFTRTAATWWALAVGVLILIILLVFIAQNTDSVPIHFLGWQWNSPIGVAFMLAAVSGALITLAAGTARIIQLRRAAKKDARAVSAVLPPNLANDK
jgi:uncharacterized integral membrane protein